MTEFWKCSECHTVNNGHHGRCIACNAKMTPLAAPAGHEEATTKVRTVSPAGPTFPRPPSRVVISSPPRSAPPPDPPRFPPPAGSSTRPPTGPGPGSSPPSLPGRVGRSRSRSFATGRFLGIGHIGLFTTALLLALSELAWGRAALSWAYHPTIAREMLRAGRLTRSFMLLPMAGRTPCPGAPPTGRICSLPWHASSCASPGACPGRCRWS